MQPTSFNITTIEGVTYRKTQAHLKPYQPQSKKLEDEDFVEQSIVKQTLKQANHKQFIDIKNQEQHYSRPMKDMKTPVNLDL